MGSIFLIRTIDDFTEDFRSSSKLWIKKAVNTIKGCEGGDARSFGGTEVHLNYAESHKRNRRYDIHCGLKHILDLFTRGVISDEIIVAQNTVICSKSYS